MDHSICRNTEHQELENWTAQAASEAVKIFFSAAGSDEGWPYVFGNGKIQLLGNSTLQTEGCLRYILQ